MAEAVYILCALTSLACAAMLLRGYARSRARFLLWSGLCFVGLTINNVLLFVDKVVFPEVAGFWNVEFAVWREHRRAGRAFAPHVWPDLGRGVAAECPAAITSSCWARS